MIIGSKRNKNIQIYINNNKIFLVMVFRIYKLIEEFSES